MKNTNAVFMRKKLNGENDNAVCVDYQVGKTDTLAHWHDACEIIFIKEGDVRCFYDNSWSRSMPGTMAFIPPGKIHCFRTDDINAKKIVIGFSQNLINTDSRISEGESFPLEIQLNDKYCHFNLEGEERIIDLLWRIVEAEELKNPVSTLIKKACILEIYAFILTSWEKGGLLKDVGKSPVIERILATIYENPLEAPSPYEMAKKLKISYSHMNSLLKKEIDASYTEFVNKIKLDMAKKLILSTDMNITDIGYACGFCDSSYFIKMFKKTNGVSPMKLRQNDKKTF